MSYSFLQLSNRFRKRLKELRQAKGFTQKEVAEYLGMKTEQYQWLERGRNKNPQLKTLYRLALVFDTDLKDLLPSIYEPGEKPAAEPAAQPAPRKARRKQQDPVESEP
ncbi:MAG TPA: helix-turn-helix transcriptional regulator [Meiothermus sp.]|nr:helix-turn-helix transcriptional regulator [Meiothermus sp.]